jgi:hypothetical protein
VSKKKNYKYGQYAVVNLHGIPATTTKTVYDQTLEAYYSLGEDLPTAIPYTGYVSGNNSNKKDIRPRKKN